MAETSGGTAGRQGLFAALRGLLATGVDILRTRGELLVTEVEEEKYRLIGLWSKAIAAVVLSTVGVILGVMAVTFAFWEQRVAILGGFAGVFLIVAVALVLTVRGEARRPSKLFKASLAELQTDLDTLRRRP